MGVMDEYNALKKKRKEEEAKSAQKSSITSVMEEYNKLKAQRQEQENDIENTMLFSSSIVPTAPLSRNHGGGGSFGSDDDIAPVAQTILGTDTRDASFWDLTWNSAKRGYNTARLGEESFAEMQGLDNDKEAYQKKLAGDDYNFAPGNWFEKAVSGAFELGGQMFRQSTHPRTLAIAGGAAGAAAIAGQAGPQVLAPEELITVPGAFLAGMAAGNAGSALEIEAGHAYNEMVEAGISKDTASKVALAVGTVNAGLEALQVDELADAYKVLKGSGATKTFVQKIIDELLERGIDVAKETVQEVAQEAVTIGGVQIAHQTEKGGSAYSAEEVGGRLLDTAKSSALSFGMMNAPATVHNIATNGYNQATSNKLTDNEQKVVDKVVEDKITEREKDGTKLTDKEKSAIRKDVIDQMDKGYISTDTIEEVLGDRTSYNSLAKEAEEYDTLYNTASGQLSKAQQDRLAELEAKNKANPYKDALKLSREQYQQSVFELVRGDRLSESYNEKTRRSQAYQADLTKYDAKQQAVIQKAIDSGILNNTNRTHEFVDMVARISADKGVPFDFTDNAKLKASGFAVDGKAVNGYLTKDGVAINIDSAKSLNSVVGHEITHVLEGTELYQALSEAVKNYAISKEGLDGFNNRLKAIEDMYKDMDADPDAEIVADLVGDYLFTDADFINNLSIQHRNVFQKIYDEIKYLCKVATAGSKEARELERVKKAFDDAYRAPKDTTKNSGTKYSLTGKTTPSYEELVAKNSVQIVKVKDGITSGSYADMKTAALNKATSEGWFNKPHHNNDTDSLIFLTEKSYSHAFSNLTAAFGEDTIRSMAHIPEIIENAVLVSVDAPKNPNRQESKVYTFFGAIDGVGGIEPVKLTVKEYDFSTLDAVPKNIRSYFEKNGVMESYDSLYDAHALEVIGIEGIKKESDASGRVNEQGSQAQATSDSEISIADLLNLVKGDAAKYIPQKQHSLSAEGEKYPVYGNYNVSGKDIALDNDIAPIAETAVKTKTPVSQTISEKESVAPVGRDIAPVAKKDAPVTEVTDMFPDTPMQSIEAPTPVKPQESVGAAPSGFNPVTHLQYEYGTIPEGEHPVRDDSLPKSTNGKDKVSLTARTVKGAEATPDELVDLLDKETVGGRFSYIPIKNSETVRKAYNEIVKKGWEAARGEWEAKVRRGEVSAELTATGALLLNNAAKAGDRKAWLSVLHDYQIMGANAGQAIQAMRILKTLSPDDILYMIERSVDQMVEDMKLGTEIKIDENLKQAYIDAKTEGERDSARKALAEDVAKQIRSTAMDKWTALRYLNMLGNLRTQGRNILGNLGMSVISGVKNTVATGIEAIAEKASGGKFHRTKSLFVGKDLLKAARNDFANVEYVALNGGKFNDPMAKSLQFQQEVQNARKIFKFVPLEMYRRATNWAMDKGDLVFSEAAYGRALAGYLKANGITETDFSKINQQTLDEARAYAVAQAQEQTFRDNNWLSSWVSKVGRRKDTPKVGKLVSEGVMPFRKTPANILLRAEEYSPLGIINATVKSVQAAKGAEGVTGADVVNSWAKALTGTGLFALGMLLNNSGVLSGGPDEDDDKEWFEEQYGWQNYSVHIGDYNFTIDFLSPEAMPLLMGAQFNELRQTGGIELKDLETALLSIADPMIEMSMLQGVNDTLDNIRYAESNMGQFLINAGLSYLTQGLTNSFLGQIERSVEGQRMSTYVDKDSDIPAWLQKALGKASAKIPGLDYQQIPYIDAWGETEDIAPLPALAENTLSPSYISQGVSDDLYDELNRLNEAQSDINVYPQAPDKTVTFDDAYGNRHEDYNLSAEEYVELAQLQGRTQKELVQEIISADLYSGLTDQEKAKAVQLAYQYAREYGRQEVLDADGFSAKWMAEAGDDIVNAIIAHTNDEMTFAYDYPEKYKFLNENGVSYDDYANGSEEFKDAYNWAFKNPEKFTLSKMVSKDVVTYRKYTGELYDIKADKDKNGKSISGSRKEKVLDYINALDADYGEKIILFRSEYPTDNTYNYEIIDYLNSRDDISYSEMETILKELGFNVSSDGNITWD